MKFQSLFALLALCVTLVSACKNDGDAARDEAVQSLTVPGAGAEGTAADGTAASTPATPEPAQNATGVWHYTCPKGCEGGSGSATPCAKCGTTLVHNTVYHPAPNPAATQAATNPAILPEGITAVPDPTSATKAPEPAQNAAGVWHYTCATGCAGGAGSAVACAKCGKTLAHNADYHK